MIIPRDLAKHQKPRPLWTPPCLARKVLGPSTERPLLMIVSRDPAKYQKLVPLWAPPFLARKVLAEMPRHKNYKRKPAAHLFPLLQFPTHTVPYIDAAVSTPCARREHAKRPIFPTHLVLANKYWETMRQCTKNTAQKCIGRGGAQCLMFLPPMSTSTAMQLSLFLLLNALHRSARKSIKTRSISAQAGSTLRP